METYDAIIVGGGLGGLTAGARLAKAGRRVLLIEQHNIPGGCATTFKRKDYVMEVGLHELDGLDETDPKKEIFEALGVFEHVEFIDLPEFYRIGKGEMEIVIPGATKAAQKVLIERFPQEERGIKRFFMTIHGIKKDIERLPKQKWKTALLFPIFPLVYPYLALNTFNTLGKYLDASLKNEELKLILSANLSYYHDDPYSMSMIYFSAAQASFFNGGGHFIRGGSQKLSDYLAKVIEDNGGDVLLNNLVTRIITKENQAVGVEFKPAFIRDAETKSSYAKVIIANAAVPNVPTMLAEEVRPLLEKKISGLEKACSILSVYIGFDKEIKELGNRHYSTFIMDESVNRLGDISTHYRVDYSKRSFAFVDYSQIDSGLAPKGKSIGVISVLDYLSDWENLDREAYQRKKQEVAETLFRRLERLIPGVTKHIECYEVGTPKTIQKFTLNPAGTAYGFAQIPRQAGLFRLPHKSSIKNLYFASAWTNPGGGFTGAILSGWSCAAEVNQMLGKSP